MTLQRKLSKEGFTEFAQTAQVDGVKEMLVDLAKIFNPIGPQLIFNLGYIMDK